MLYRQYWTREAQTGDVKLENNVQDNVVQDNVVHRTPNTKTLYKNVVQEHIEPEHVAQRIVYREMLYDEMLNMFKNVCKCVVLENDAHGMMYRKCCTRVVMFVAQLTLVFFKRIEIHI